MSNKNVMDCDPPADAPSLEAFGEMSESELAAIRAAIVRELPTQAPIFLPTEKITLKEQVTGLIRVRDIYRTRLDSIYRPRLRGLREQFRHRQRCFVIGNGPSLNRTDLAILKDEVTFAVNGFFLKARELDWCPTFYVVEDHLVAEDRREAIEAFHGPTKLFPAYLGYCFKESDDTIFFNHRPRKSYPRGFDFSTEADQITYTGCTVTFTCLQLAYYLGFQEIYLIGVDSDYAIPADAQHKKDYGVGVIDMKSDDTNHFHPDYFGKGFRWHDPQVHKMLEVYAEARLVADRTGRLILNATVGGKLEVFERVAFTALFPDARSPEELDRVSAAGLQGAKAESTGLRHGKLQGVRNAALPDVRARLGESRPEVGDRPQHSSKETTAEEDGVNGHQVPAELPRLLVFDITKRGDGTATGEIKATLLAGWPADRLVQFYSSGRDQIDVDGIVPQILRNSFLAVEDVARVVRWFGPDMILYRPVPDNLALHQAAMTLIRASDLPLAVWIMDDWPSRLATEDPALFVRFDSDLRELLARATLRLSICDAMSTAFAERYGVSFKAFANAIDPAEWPLPERSDAQSRPFVVRYAGSLATHMGLASVRRIARAVERLASDGIDIEFEISTHPNWQRAAETEFHEIKRTSYRTETQTPAAYRSWLSQADALVIAYNFDDISRHYVRYSLANKLPECLASGAVLFAHGPSDAATIEYIRSLNCGVVLTEEDEGALANALRALVQDPNRRRDLSVRARAIAFDAHNVNRVRHALHAEFVAITAREKTAKTIVTASRLQELNRALERRVALLDACLAVLEKRGLDEQGLEQDLQSPKPDYLQTIRQIREAACAVLPQNATVLVISRGDDQLLCLGGQQGWHFPQTEAGQYAGYYPADSDDAIAHLEALRCKGAHFLLVPNTAFWWFQQYTDFKRHLDTHYQRVLAWECCVIYRLTASRVNPQLQNESKDPGESRIAAASCSIQKPEVASMEFVEL